MGDEDILQVGGVAARLGIEVRTAVLETTAADNLHHSLNEFEVVNGELVGIPSVLIVATVGVDGAQHTVVHGHGQFVFECMSSQSRVVHLDVHFEILVQPVCLQEADDGLRVHVILMLGGLHRLRLHKEGTLKATGTGIVAGHAQHRGQVFLLAFLVGVEQAHVALAATPEDVVRSAQLDGGVDGILDLHGGTGYDVEVGVRGSAVHIALVAEDIGRTPQQFDTRLLLFLFQVGYDFLQIGFVFLDGVGLGTEVHVVEAVVLDTHLLHEFKTGVHLVLGSLHGIGRVVPRESLRTAAELVATFGAQRVPPGHGEL